MPRKRRRKTKVAIKTWLRNKGHRKEWVDGSMSVQSIVRGVCKVHNIDLDEYRSAGGVV